MHAHDTPDGDDGQPIEPTPPDLDQLLDAPSGPDEPPARAIGSVTRYVHDVADAASARVMRRIGEGVQQAIEDHEARYHRGQVPLDTLEDLQGRLGAGS